MECALDEGRVDWRFELINFPGGYQGVSVGISLHNLPQVFALLLKEVYPLNIGDWFFAQNWGPFYERRVSLSAPINIQRNYFAWTQPFLFIAGSEGVVASFYADAVYAEVSESQHGDDLLVQTKIPIEMGAERGTPAKFFLWKGGDFSDKWASLNEWTALYESLSSFYLSILSSNRILSPQFFILPSFGTLSIFISDFKLTQLSKKHYNTSEVNRR